MNSKNDMQNIDDGFYRAFEDKFRGSRETIKSRLKFYIPFIEPLKVIHGTCKAIDLGCGRGEWLELLSEIGLAAHGVDLDEGMLAACRERGLSVETGDAISHLISLPAESQDIVSGFHIIEHIPFADLQILIREAYRVLRPAGLLILETPNPENIVVSSTTFYLDPSHLHPIPPPLLAFLTEYHGFHRNRILRLQEPIDAMMNRLPSLSNVFYGVSPDYSVIAQKPATEEQIRIFNPAFLDEEHGLSLEKLAGHFDAQVAHALNGTHVRLENIQAELNNIYHSRSWQLTQPLRWLNWQRKRLQEEGLFARLKAVYKRIFPRHNTRSDGSKSRENQKNGNKSVEHKTESEPDQAHRDLHHKVLLSEGSPATLGGLRRIVRSWLLSIMKQVSNYARRTPGFRRLAIRMLHRFPGLELKLRRFYQEGQNAKQLGSTAWNSQSGYPGVSRGGDLYKEERAGLYSSAIGINALQRTPLEANYRKFRKKA